MKYKAKINCSFKIGGFKMIEYSPQNFEEKLAQFTGSDNVYWHAVGEMVFTDGVKFLADVAQCYWLLDIIGSYLIDPKIRELPFQIWELKVNEDNSAVVTMKEDTDLPKVVRQEIPFTDFPLKEIKFYFTQAILMLPSEY